MKRFHTVTVRPTIPASKQHLGAFADGDVLFDWTAFNVPRGAHKLVGMQAVIRGANSTAQTFAVNAYFAKSINGVAPGTLGTIHATANKSALAAHNYLGALQAEEPMASQLDLDNLSILRFAHGDASMKTTIGETGLVLQGEPDSGINVGYDKLYIGATTPDGAATFSTNVETTGALDVSAAAAARVDSLDNGAGGTAGCTAKFVPGDIIHAEDDIILGEIKTVAADELTFKTDGSVVYHGNNEVLFTNPDGVANWAIQNGADAAGDLADGDELYNIHPITLLMSFEM